MPPLKQLSKRQVQRQTKKRFLEFKKQCCQSQSQSQNSSNTNETVLVTPLVAPLLVAASVNSGSVFSDNACRFNEYEKDKPIVVQTGPEFELISEEQSSSDSDNNTDNNLQLKEQLREWACSENITATATTKLLKILKPHFNFLPTDSRGLLQTPRTVETINLSNGSMFYIGIYPQLIIRLNGGFRNNVKKILLQINIDGLPLFKSSGTELYPILALCPDLNDHNPFTVACFSGTGKPQPLERFLGPFLNEIKELRRTGCTFQNNTYEIDIHFFICDAPARAYLKGIVGHTSKHGCEKCNIVGTYQNHRINFATASTHSLILDKDFEDVEAGTKPFIKNRSPLLDIGIKLTTQFPLDPMHLVFLGVMKRMLLNYYIQGNAPHKLSQKHIASMNTKITVIKLHQPSEFVRKARSFYDVKRWKATEYRSFLLYHGLLVLHNELNKEQYKHFLLFHCALFILSNEKMIALHIDLAENFLKKFVSTAESILDKDFVVYNVHNLIHLCNDVRRYGSVNKYSCFPFENHLSHLKKKIHSKKHTLQQVYNRLKENEEYIRQKLISNTAHSGNVNFTIKCKYNENFDVTGRLLFCNCRKVYFQFYYLTDSVPNNCVLTKSGKVCLIRQILVTENKLTFEAECFKYQFDLYTYPMQSSKLSIFFCKGLGDDNYLLFSQTQIMCKGFLNPHKDGYAFFPLNHLYD